MREATFLKVIRKGFVERDGKEETMSCSHCADFLVVPWYKLGWSRDSDVGGKSCP